MCNTKMSCKAQGYLEAKRQVVDAIYARVDVLREEQAKVNKRRFDELEVAIDELIKTCSFVRNSMLWKEEK